MTDTTNPTAAEVRALIDGWAAAELAGDVPALDRLLADDFVGVGPLGFLLTKEEWLARHASGDLAYASFAWDEPRVRVYGDAAVVIGRQTAAASYQGRPVPAGALRTTHVLLRQDGHWRLAGIHMSPIGPPPA